MAAPRPTCVMGDAGISVFLLSLPFGKEVEFYRTELRDGAFAKYKKAVMDRLQGRSASRDEFADVFYEPRAYYLFGRFDLAVLSLVDDFEFSSRTFHPFDPMMAHTYEGSGRKPYFQNFLHKVITGPTPSFGAANDLVPLARRVFLDRTKPLFGIMLLKINNSLLIGCGGDMLRATVRQIRLAAKPYRAMGLDVVILESYSWHEVTVLMFAASYHAMKEFTSAIKDVQLKDLAERDLVHHDSSLFSCYVNRFNKDWDCAHSHVFADVETILGFDFALVGGDREVLRTIDPSDRVDLITRWFVKPGHVPEAAAILKRAGYDLKLALGRGDLVSRLPPESGPNSPREPKGRLTTDALELFGNLALRDALRPHVLQRSSALSFLDVPIADDTIEVRAHPAFADAIRDLEFTIVDLAKIEENLRELGTPKILALKVLNMYANLNDGLLDRNLYGFFAEMLPFMQDLERHIRDKVADPPVDTTQWCHWLQKVQENFELAYRNRFHNSHRLGEITDFNIDFKGGIQQLVTALDGANKAIASAVGNRNSFVSVAGEPAVHSTRLETRLNYFHAFQPEAFLTVAVHESAFYLMDTPPDDPLLADQWSQLRELMPGVRAEIRESWSAARSAKVLPSSARPGDDDRAFLTALLLDRLAFCSTFNRRADLLCFWYWGYHAQTHKAYHRPLIASRARTADFVLRLSAVCDLHAGDVEQVFSPFKDSTFGEAWRSRKAEIEDSLRRLRGGERFQAWRRLAWQFADDLVCSVWQGQAGLSLPRPTVEEVATRVTAAATEVAAAFNRGETVPFELTGPFATFRYCQSVFFAYLQMVQSFYLSDPAGNTNVILTREGEHRSASPQKQQGRLFFDPLGGIFTRDAALRRHYFKCRSALTMSLWDMSVKAKRDVILDRLIEGAARL